MGQNGSGRGGVISVVGNNPHAMDVLWAMVMILTEGHGSSSKIPNQGKFYDWLERGIIVGPCSMTYVWKGKEVTILVGAEEGIVLRDVDIGRQRFSVNHHGNPDSKFHVVPINIEEDRTDPNFRIAVRRAVHEILAFRCKNSDGELVAMRAPKLESKPDETEKAA